VPAPARSPGSDRPSGGEAVWIRVAALAAFAAGPIVPVRVGGQALLLVRDGDRVFAVERACPHEGADLAKGRCADGRLHCPHHQASFALADGAVSPGWSFRPLRIYPIQIVDGDIYIESTCLIKVQ
jgi:nitrite reductase/ring-hydroxylating ferredoxin subunit